MEQNDTIFGRILRGELPADIVHEDDDVIAFRDINPQAPVHILVIPRRWLKGVGSATEDDRELLGHMMWVAAEIARKVGIADKGYRLVVNQGRHGQQSVDHLHIHLLGGRQMSWPPG